MLRPGSISFLYEALLQEAIDPRVVEAVSFVPLKIELKDGNDWEFIDY